MKTETTEKTYNNYPIMTDQKRDLSCDTRILNEIERQFEYAEETKNKIFFMRYDIRFPEGYNHADNGIFSEFQSKFMKNLSRKGLKPQYVAVREQSREKHQHYHVALILDGQKTQSIHNHIRTAERLWDLTLGLPEKENGYGLIDDCTTAEPEKNRLMGLCLDMTIPGDQIKKMIVSEEPVI